jgi:F-type H+-transporting ATPase subunit epsilon
MAKLRLDIVTAEETVYSDEVDVLVAPGAEGEIAILPHHAGLLTLLQPGVMLIRKGDEETPLAVSGGFLEVTNDRVIVLADTAERADEIDAARAEEARQRALGLLTQKATATDLAAAAASLRRSQVRLRVARRRRPERSRPE